MADAVAKASQCSNDMNLPRDFLWQVFGRHQSSKSRDEQLPFAKPWVPHGEPVEP
jgi:hypothetical protein